MDVVRVYVLVATEFQREREARKNLGVTTDLTIAECHRAQTPEPTSTGFVEFSFDTFVIPANGFQAGVEVTALVQTVREFRAVVKPLNEYIENMRKQ